MDIIAMTSAIPLWVALAGLCTALLYVCCGFHRRIWYKFGVPGPSPLPFLGNAHQLLKDTKSMIEEGTSFLNQKYGKVYGAYFFNLPVLYVHDIEVVKQICIKDFNKFTDRSHAGDGGFYPKTIVTGLIFQKGNLWKRARKIISPIFSVGKLKLVTNYTNVISRDVADSFMELAGKESLIASKEVYRALSLDSILGTLYGMTIGSQESTRSQVRGIVDRAFKVKPLATLALCLNINIPFLKDLVRKFNISLVDNECVEYFVSMIRKCVEDRKQNPLTSKRTDLIQLLLKAEMETGSDSDVLGEKKFTLEEVEGHSLNFLLAGFESTASTLRFLSYSIAKDRNIQNKLVEEIEEVVGEEEEVSYEICHKLRYMEAVILETLRMYPPVTVTSRDTIKQAVVQGFTVVPGSAIYINLFKIGRDSDVYDHPNTFDPDRFFVDAKDGIDTDTVENNKDGAGHNGQTKSSKKTPAQCFSFGVGPRACVGIKLAILTLKIALVHILRKVDFLDATPNELKLAYGLLTLDTKEPVNLKVAKRQRNKQ